jgi:hypothetical protein
MNLSASFGIEGSVSCTEVYGCYSMPCVNAASQLSSKFSFRLASEAGVSRGALGLVFLLAQLAALPASFSATVEAKTATVTSITLSAAGSPVTSVASGTVVTLTAEVTAGGKAVSPGQVNFCDAKAKYCTDIHLLGVAQLTKAGAAEVKIPGRVLLLSPALLQTLTRQGELRP